MSQLKSVHREDQRYGSYEEVLFKRKKCIKKNFEFVYPDGFKKFVEGKDARKKFDPNYFVELLDFESGRYDTRSRRRSSRSSRSSRRSSRSKSSGSNSSKGGSANKSTNLKPYEGNAKVKPSFWVTW